MRLIGIIMKKRLALIFITLSLSILGISMMLYWNSQVSQMIDAVSTGEPISRETIIRAAAVIALMAVNGFVTLYLSGWTCETIGHDLRIGITRSLLGKFQLQLEMTSAGQVLSKTQNELTEATAFLRNNLFAFIEDLVNFSGTFLWMMIISPRLTLLSHAALIPITWYVFKASQIIQEYTNQSQSSNAKVGGWIDALTAVFPIMRIFQAEPAVVQWHKRALSQWEDHCIRGERVRARLMSLSGVLRFLPLILIFALGGRGVILGEMSIGTLYILINLSGNVSGLATNMPSRIAGFRSFAANMHRIENQFGESGYETA